MLHIQLNWHSLPNRGQVLDKIEWEFPSGCLTGIIGSNGAGKSTLLRLLSGWEMPSSGTVTWCDQALTSYSPRELARMRIYLPQAATRHVPMLTVQEIIGLGCGKEVVTRRSLIETAMEWMGLTKYAAIKYSELSGGEQQRVHLARCRVQLEAASFWNIDTALETDLNSISTAPITESTIKEPGHPAEFAENNAESMEAATENDMEVITDSMHNEENNQEVIENVILEAPVEEVKEKDNEHKAETKRNYSVSSWGILDEPLQGLDVYYQKVMLGYWRDWAKQHNATLVMSLHQLDIAAQYMDSVLLLKEGKMIAAGKTSQVLTPENLDCLYAPSE